MTPAMIYLSGACNQTCLHLPSMSPSMKGVKYRSHDSFALNYLPSRRHSSSDSGNSFDSNADARSVPKHLQRVEEQKGNIGILRQIFAFMSHTPLISSPEQTTASYGIIPGEDSVNKAAEVDYDDSSNPSERNGEKGKSSAIGASDSAGRSSSRRNQSRTSNSQGHIKDQDLETPTGNASDNEDDSAEELIYDEDGNGSSWNDESPPDNSS